MQSEWKFLHSSLVAFMHPSSHAVQMLTAIMVRDEEGIMYDATVDIRRVIKKPPVGFEILHTLTTLKQASLLNAILYLALPSQKKIVYTICSINLQVLVA